MVAGVPARLDRLYQGRAVEAFDLAKFGPETGKPKHPATAWVVNGVRSRPINGPEPRLLGQAWTEAEKSARLAKNAAARKPAPGAQYTVPSTQPAALVNARRPARQPPNQVLSTPYRVLSRPRLSRKSSPRPSERR